MPESTVGITLDGRQVAIGTAERSTAGAVYVYGDVLEDLPPIVVERFDRLEGEFLGRGCGFASTDLLCFVDYRSGLLSFSPTGGSW